MIISRVLFLQKLFALLKYLKNDSYNYSTMIEHSNKWTAFYAMNKLNIYT